MNKNFNLTTKKGRKKATDTLDSAGVLMNSINSIATITSLAGIASSINVIDFFCGALFPPFILLTLPLALRGYALWNAIIRENQLKLAKELLKLGKRKRLKKLKIKLNNNVGLSPSTKILGGVPIRVFLGGGSSLTLKAKYF